MATNADQVWELLAQLVESQAQLVESQAQLTESQKETDLKFRETDLQIKELGKQIGSLGNKFGSFTEGLALPSMQTILREQFGMEIISPSVRVKKGGENLEIDVLAYTNGDINKAMIVEVKSHVQEKSIAQLVKILENFRTFFPEHQNKQVYGILAGVDMSEEMKNMAIEAGLYVANIQDEVFQIDTPPSFEPKAW
ncbi:DUF3782 domain-containing protein [Cylindrospermopsis raciborskii]|uniref:DUF3782 domain-containing protein n=1 Tax=Cylindrospermopsis raciborskii TaxID=77022 RepID=UPI0008DC6BC2|nr:DUF3782 domain-containing protein [Cylindrospermopsis raciborskii]NLQ06197.1 DUF3782 domain-containing protein [Cylindrospermopsis raciborskii MVCC19]OHY35770.1 DUF3782 domain-containing protein [Cylindrospermopsis raciborskii MVCC14]